MRGPPDYSPPPPLFGQRKSFGQHKSFGQRKRAGAQQRCAPARIFLFQTVLGRELSASRRGGIGNGETRAAKEAEAARGIAPADENCLRRRGDPSPPLLRPARPNGSAPALRSQEVARRAAAARGGVGYAAPSICSRPPPRKRSEGFRRRAAPAERKSILLPPLTRADYAWRAPNRRRRDPLVLRSRRPAQRSMREVRALLRRLPPRLRPPHRPPPGRDAAARPNRQRRYRSARRAEPACRPAARSRTRPRRRGDKPPARPSTPADVYKKGGQAARRMTDPAGVYEMIRGLFSCMKRMKAFCSKLRIAAGANI